MPSKRVLFIAPYGNWLVHNQVDAVIATALVLRGCEVLVAGCDGLYGDDCCLMAYVSDAEKTAVCQICQQTGQHFFSQSFQLPFTTLGAWLNDNDRLRAEAWVDALDPQDYPTAIYTDESNTPLEIGEWTLSSVYTHFRIAETGLSRPEVRVVHRRYLRDALLTYWSVSRLADGGATTLFLFNGRFLPYRIAYEVARMRGLDVITHERGSLPDSFNFYDQGTFADFYIRIAAARPWLNAPLTTQELDWLTTYFRDREFGQGTNYPSFYGFQTADHDVRRRLNIPHDARIVSVFTSSEDELAAFDSDDIVANQLLLVDRLIEAFTDRPEYLVIRHHPYIAGLDSYRPDCDFLSRAYDQARRSPQNVRIVMPSEQLTSYALLWHSMAAIAPVSTVAIEAIARGIPAVVASFSEYSDVCICELDRTLSDRNFLNDLVERLISGQLALQPDDLRRMYRYVYAYMNRFPMTFQSLGIKNFFEPDVRIENPARDLAAGHDPTLDRLCDRLLHHAPLYPHPDRDSATRSLAAETAYLDANLRDIQLVREQAQQAARESAQQAQSIPIAVLGSHHALEASNLTRSRHRAWRLEPSTYDPRQPAITIETWLAQLHQLPEDFVTIAHPQVQYDEAFLSTGIDTLTEGAAAAPCNGVRFGTWLAQSGQIYGQAFTKIAPVSSAEQAESYSPWFRQPLSALFFGIFRKAALMDWLQTVQAIAQQQGMPTAHRWLFDRLQQPDIASVSVHMAVIHEQPTPSAIAPITGLTVPVALLIFNRPQLTARVLDILRQVRPTKLLVVADGPRSDRPGEAALCQQTRDMIEQVDWPCEILRHYADQNLGCRRRVASGLDWVFSQVEQAIILEDDCLPDPSFFQFCEAILDRYRDDDRVMAISGDNFQGDRPVTEDSYYFSRYPHIWGWATWRRAWQHYDLAMADWPALRDRGWLFKLLRDQASAQYWSNIFQGSYEGFDTWDYAWVFACWRRGGLTILPARNLVSNAGFGEQATHTKGDSPLANLPAETLAFPLRHPSQVVHCVAADDFSESRLFSGSSMLSESLEQRQWVDRAASLRQMLLQQPTLAGAYSALGEALDGLADHSAGDRARHIDQQLQQHYRDYIAPGLQPVFPDAHFPNLTLGDRTPIAWPYLRKEIPHNWYVDRRSPTVGFLSRDEAHLLYNLALAFQGQPALEIGCWMGWSACHLALAGVQLDVVDPLLGDPGVYQTVSDSLTSAGVRDRVNLVPGYSPQAVQALAAQRQQPWSLIFIDGNHERPGPLEDAMVCAQLAAPDAAIVFHDLASPDVAEGLEYLRQQGWNTMVYQTMQIMGVAWRGQVQPVRHLPDPSVRWELPAHLQSFMVSGVSDGAIADGGLTEFQQWLPVVRPYTFLSEARLLSLYRLTKDICLADLPGNIVECGTCKGGAAALIAATIARYSRRPRKVYAFDTFEGMPDPTEVDRANGVPANDTGFGAGTLGAPIEQNLNVVCRALGVESIVVPVKGLFNQTLPVTRGQIGDIALLHADGDWYESTIDIFQYLYGQVIAGGAIQIDDYGHWEGCRKAIDDLQAQWRVQFGLQPIDYTGVWFRKDPAATPRAGL